MSRAPERLVRLGRVSGVLGVKGWIKVHSYTDPRDNIVRFTHWILCQQGNERQMEVEQGRSQGKSVVAKLAQIDDRDQAGALIGADIAVTRSELPPCEPGEFYWVDLEGLRVETTDGRLLGTVNYIVATGANDVIVVSGERERLIPFDMTHTVRSVDFDAGTIVVEWDADL
jgi:16S rRNA processing protein RimM